MLQVAAHAEGGKRATDEEPVDQCEARGQMADARRGLESVQAQLQELYDKIEEQGNFVALDQINAMYGSLAGAVGGVEGVEQLLAKKPKSRWQRAQYFTMGAPAHNELGGQKPPQPIGAKTNGGGGGNEARQKGADGHGPEESKAGGALGGAAVSGGADALAGVAADDGRRQHGGDGTPSAATNSSTAPRGTDGTREDGAHAAAIRFGGAANDEQESQLLQAEAVQALEQARAKFAEAEKGPNTDNAALLFAHQCVLAKVGTPSTLAELHAFERWRKAPGENLERIAAGAFARQEHIGENNGQWLWRHRHRRLCK